MKTSSLNKLKLWLSRDSACLSHESDEYFFHDFLHDYVLNHRDSGTESDISERILENANRDMKIVEVLISKALISYHAVSEFDKRQRKAIKVSPF